MHPSLHALVEELAQTDLPVPEPGDDLLDASGRVAVTAELVWADAHVAVLLDADLDPAPPVEPGWKLLSASTTPDAVAAAIRS